MSVDESPIGTEAALTRALKVLLAEAYDNGVSVEGGWECRNGPDHPDWDVVVTEVTKPDEPT